MYGKVTIKVERIAHKAWSSCVVIWLYLPITNRRGRVLAAHGTVQGWIRIGGTEQYRTVETRSEALRLAITQARAWIRQNRSAQNVHARQLQNKD